MSIKREREKTTTKQQSQTDNINCCQRWGIGTLILLLVGMQNGIDTLEDCLAVSYYAKQGYHTI